MNGKRNDVTQAIVPYAKATSTALIIPETLDEKRWEEQGRYLAASERALMWWIGDWWAFGERKYGERKAWATENNANFQTFRDAGWVSGAYEMSERSDVLAWSHHRVAAVLDDPVRSQLLAEAEAGGWSVQQLRSAVRRIKTAERIGKAADDAEDLATLDQYQVIYADPPWQYEHAEPTRAIDNNYWPAELDAIKALVPPAADDAVLLCWATSPKLAEAMQVIEAWGFEYRTCMVWVKGEIEDPTMGMGYYARQAHELLLIAKRGELPVPAPENRPLSVIAAPRTEHSEKPDVFYEVIERMYPAFSRVEMFARQRREGWYGWGDQA